MKKMNQRIVKRYDKNFEDFLLYAHKGFIRGQQTHGEHSNKKMNLIKEIKEELRDVACYAFFQFERLNDIENKMRRLK